MEILVDFMEKAFELTFSRLCDISHLRVLPPLLFKVRNVQRFRERLG